MSSRRVLIVAGEASGDMHAANLVRELKKLEPELSFFGIGGSRMENAGVEVLRRMEELSVVGFSEVLSKLGAIRGAMSHLFKETSRRRPHMAVLVDYPGFNLRFARLIRGSLPKIFYYIGPQVWAWGGWRARSVSLLFDGLISVIPFECDLYEGTRLECHFVGHPILDLVNPKASKDEFRSEYCPGNGTLIGIVPGSRDQEVRRILPIMLNCAKMIREKKKETCFAIGVAETIDTEFVRSLCEKTFTDVSVLEGKTYEVMQASDLLMVASGTATLEAAVLGIPMSIIYKTSPLTWALAKALIKVKSVGLVNIIAGRRVVPEFIQFQATPKKICDQILSLLSDRERMEETRNALSEVRSQLGNPGASRRAAEIILNLSEKRCSMNASR